jgi:hypothetical protein
MATYQILSWQEIPSLVEARDEKGAHKEQLSQRFQVLIDQVAMERQFAGTDAYLEQWNKSAKQDRPGSAAEVAKAVARDLEDRFPAIKAVAAKKTAAGTA